MPNVFDSGSNARPPAPKAPKLPTPRLVQRPKGVPQGSPVGNGPISRISAWKPKGPLDFSLFPKIQERINEAKPQSTYDIFQVVQPIAKRRTENFKKEYGFGSDFADKIYHGQYLSKNLQTWRQIQGQTDPAKRVEMVNALKKEQGLNDSSFDPADMIYPDDYIQKQIQKQIDDGKKYGLDLGYRPQPVQIKDKDGNVRSPDISNPYDASQDTDTLDSLLLGPVAHGLKGKKRKGFIKDYSEVKQAQAKLDHDIQEASHYLGQDSSYIKNYLSRVAQENNVSLKEAFDDYMGEGKLRLAAAVRSPELDAVIKNKAEVDGTRAEEVERRKKTNDPFVPVSASGLIIDQISRPLYAVQNTRSYLMAQDIGANDDEGWFDSILRNNPVSAAESLISGGRGSLEGLDDSSVGGAWDAMKKGFMLKEKRTGSDIISMNAAADPDENIFDNKIYRGIAGFTQDVVFDPLSYGTGVGVAAAPMRKATIALSARKGSEQMARNLVEHFDVPRAPFLEDDRLNKFLDPDKAGDELLSLEEIQVLTGAKPPKKSMTVAERKAMHEDILYGSDTIGRNMRERKLHIQDEAAARQGMLDAAEEANRVSAKIREVTGQFGVDTLTDGVKRNIMEGTEFADDVLSQQHNLTASKVEEAIKVHRMQDDPRTFFDVLENHLSNLSLPESVKKEILNDIDQHYLLRDAKTGERIKGNQEIYRSDLGPEYRDNLAVAAKHNDQIKYLEDVKKDVEADFKAGKIDADTHAARLAHADKMILSAKKAKDVVWNRLNRIQAASVTQRISRYTERAGGKRPYRNEARAAHLTKVIDRANAELDKLAPNQIGGDTAAVGKVIYKDAQRADEVQLLLRVLDREKRDLRPSLGPSQKRRGVASIKPHEEAKIREIDSQIAELNKELEALKVNEISGHGEVNQKISAGVDDKTPSTTLTSEKLLTEDEILKQQEEAYARTSARIEEREANGVPVIDRKLEKARERDASTQLDEAGRKEESDYKTYDFHEDDDLEELFASVGADEFGLTQLRDQALKQRGYLENQIGEFGRESVQAPASFMHLDGTLDEAKISEYISINNSEIKEDVAIFHANKARSAGLSNEEIEFLEDFKNHINEKGLDDWQAKHQANWRGPNENVLDHARRNIGRRLLESLVKSDKTAVGSKVRKFLTYWDPTPKRGFHVTGNDGQKIYLGDWQAIDGKPKNMKDDAVPSVMEPYVKEAHETAKESGNLGKSPLVIEKNNKVTVDALLGKSEYVPVDADYRRLHFALKRTGHAVPEELDLFKEWTKSRQGKRILKLDGTTKDLSANRQVFWEIFEKEHKVSPGTAQSYPKITQSLDPTIVARQNYGGWSLRHPLGLDYVTYTKRATGDLPSFIRTFQTGPFRLSVKPKELDLEGRLVLDKQGNTSLSSYGRTNADDEVGELIENPLTPEDRSHNDAWYKARDHFQEEFLTKYYEKHRANPADFLKRVEDAWTGRSGKIKGTTTNKNAAKEIEEVTTDLTPAALDKAQYDELLRKEKTNAADPSMLRASYADKEGFLKGEMAKSIKDPSRITRIPKPKVPLEETGDVLGKAYRVLRQKLGDQRRAEIAEATANLRGAAKASKTKAINKRWAKEVNQKAAPEYLALKQAEAELRAVQEKWRGHAGRLETAYREAKETRDATRRYLLEDKALDILSEALAPMTKELQFHALGRTYSVPTPQIVHDNIVRAGSAPGISHARRAYAKLFEPATTMREEAQLLRSAAVNNTPVVIGWHIDRLNEVFKGTTVEHRSAVFSQWLKDPASAREMDAGLVDAMEKHGNEILGYFNYDVPVGENYHITRLDINKYLPEYLSFSHAAMFGKKSGRFKDVHELFEALGSSKRIQQDKGLMAKRAKALEDPFLAFWNLRVATELTKGRKFLEVHAADMMGFRIPGTETLDKIASKETVAKVRGALTDLERAGWKPIKGVADNRYIFPPEIQEDMERLFKMLEPRNIGTLGKFFDDVTNVWKTQILIYNPGMYVRNLIGETLVGYLDGVTNPELYRKSAQFMHYLKSEGKDLEFLGQHMPELSQIDSGRIKGSRVITTLKSGHKLTFDELAVLRSRVGLHTGFTSTDAAEALMAGKSQPIRESVPGKVASGTHRGLKKVAEVGEDFPRMAHFIHALNEAPAHLSLEKAAEYAAKRVRKYHLDYSDVTKAEKAVMMRANPFYKWTRKNIPLMIQMLFLKPGKMVAPIKAMSGLQEAVGEDIDERITAQDFASNPDPNGIVPDIKGVLPSFMLDVMAFHLGTDEDNNKTSAYIQTPQVDAMRSAVGLASGVGSALQGDFKGAVSGLEDNTIVQMGNPIFKAPIEQLMGRKIGGFRQSFDATDSNAPDYPYASSERRITEAESEGSKRLSGILDYSPIANLIDSSRVRKYRASDGGTFTERGGLTLDETFLRFLSGIGFMETPEDRPFSPSQSPNMVYVD